MATYRDPFERLQGELERMLEQAFAAFGPGGVSPSVDVFDAGDAFVVKAELPGLDPRSVEVSVEDGALTLRGERKLPEPQAGAAFHRREREEGAFRRVVRMPARVAADQTQAEYRDGVLTVRLPKAPESRPRRVEIQAA
ncbi:MAG TPA: Hsp20/alpha crystallin family protein [Candidatus Binatia bacterium]|nr:Hsp20/alpha crystallin family protein [Candidatus Binatia bacterium]